MPPAQVSIPARRPVEAFDQQTIDEFHENLAQDEAAPALNPNERSRLKMVLEADYTISKRDIFGQEKSKKDYKREQTRLWNDKKRWNLNIQNQVVRNAENAFGERIAACTWDADSYIIKTHNALGHADVTKTFNALQEEVYGIQRRDVYDLVFKCAICTFTRCTNSTAPLEPIIVERVIERLQINLIDFRSTPNGHFKWVLHLKDHFLKYTCLFPLRSKTASEVTTTLAIFLMCFRPPEIVQIDNGKEFKGLALILLKRFGIRIING